MSLASWKRKSSTRSRRVAITICAGLVGGEQGRRLGGLGFVGAAGHHAPPFAPNPALRHFVGDVTDARAVGFAALTMHPARQNQPGVEVVLKTDLHALEHFEVVGRAETG